MANIQQQFDKLNLDDTNNDADMGRIQLYDSMMQPTRIITKAVKGYIPPIEARNPNMKYRIHCVSTKKHG